MALNTCVCTCKYTQYKHAVQIIILYMLSKKPAAFQVIYSAHPHVNVLIHGMPYVHYPLLLSTLLENCIKQKICKRTNKLLP